MKKTDTAPDRTLADLEAAVLAGDATITADDLADAEARERHAALLVEAQTRKAQAAAAEHRQREIDRLRADIESLDDDRAQLRQLAVAAVAAVEAVFVAARARGHQLDD